MNQLSVLVVDDEEIDRYLLRRDLKRGGIDARIFECTDGLDALEFLRDLDANREKFGADFPPAIIFLDINMPRVNGFEFLQQFAAMRSERKGYDNCVIMMFSSSEHPSERERASSYEFVADFVVKGQTSAEELRDKVLNLLAT